MVSDGFARNYLIPKKMGALATPEIIKAVEKVAIALQEEAKIQKKNIAEFAEKIDKRTLELSKPADAKGHLYASLKESEIFARIKGQIHDLPEKASLVDYKPIKKIGDHKVVLELGSQITEINLKIKAK